MPTFIIDDWESGEAREVEIAYEDLDERYVALLALSGDEDAARWLDTRRPLTGRNG